MDIFSCSCCAGVHEAEIQNKLPCSIWIQARLYSLCLCKLVPLKLFTRESNLFIHCSGSQACVPEAQSHSRLPSPENLFIRKKQHGSTLSFLSCRSQRKESRSEHSSAKQWRVAVTGWYAKMKPPKHRHTHLPISYPVTTKTRKMATHSQMHKFAVRTKAAINIPRSQ